MRMIQIHLCNMLVINVIMLVILDCCFPSSQAIRIKIVYLASFKNGDNTDMNTIPQILVFRKTNNCFATFCLS